MNEKEFVNEFYNQLHDYMNERQTDLEFKDKLWQWIEEYGNKQRIDEIKRHIDLIMHLPDSQYDDLEIKRICERRIKELNKLTPEQVLKSMKKNQ